MYFDFISWIQFDTLYLIQFLQRLMGGVIAVVLRPQEAQCPVVRSIARELLTSLVIEPVMNFASPGYVIRYFHHLLRYHSSSLFSVLRVLLVLDGLPYLISGIRGIFYKTIQKLY